MNLSPRTTKNIFAGAGLASTVAYICRRPDQFLDPQIWNEEGLILQSLSEVGVIETTWFPFAGYLLLPTNFILAVLGAIDISAAPFLFAIFARTVFVGYLCLWAVPDSTFSPVSRAVIMILSALLPSDPETFGVGLYTFWWLQLFVLPMLFWTSPRGGGGTCQPQFLLLPALVVQ